MVSGPSIYVKGNKKGFIIYLLQYFVIFVCCCNRATVVVEVRAGARSTAVGVSAVEYGVGLRAAGVELCARHSPLGQPSTQCCSPPVFQVSRQPMHDSPAS